MLQDATCAWNWKGKLTQRGKGNNLKGWIEVVQLCNKLRKFRPIYCLESFFKACRKYIFEKLAFSKMP